MTATEQSLLQALIELEQTAQSMPTARPRPDLLPFFARIDELTRQLPKDTDPALLHYLQRKSYEKARRWLEGLEAENHSGNCRH